MARAAVLTKTHWIVMVTSHFDIPFPLYSTPCPQGPAALVSSGSPATAGTRVRSDREVVETFVEQNVVWGPNAPHMRRKSLLVSSYRVQAGSASPFPQASRSYTNSGIAP